MHYITLYSEGISEASCSPTTKVTCDQGYYFTRIRWVRSWAVAPCPSTYPSQCQSRNSRCMQRILPLGTPSLYPRRASPRFQGLHDRNKVLDNLSELLYVKGPPWEIIHSIQVRKIAFIYNVGGCVSCMNRDDLHSSGHGHDCKGSVRHSSYHQLQLSSSQSRSLLPLRI